MIFIKKFLNQKKSKKNSAVIFIISAVILSFFALYFVLRFSPYKAFDEFLEREYSIRYYDKNAELLQIPPLQNGLRREWICIENVPENVQKIFIKAEDRRFYFHIGIDFFSIINAFFQNIQNGRIIRGGSTITMQLCGIIDESFYGKKNNSIKNKFIELINSLRIESRLSKKQILELYLNSVPFSHNCEGISSACRTYFGKDVKNLTEEESCVLAVIPRRPKSNNPINNKNVNFQKAAKLYESIYHKEFQTKNIYIQKFSYPYKMPHYIRFIQKKIDENSKKNGEIHLSVDSALYDYAKNIMIDSLLKASSSRISNASLLLINNSDSSVLAWIGNADDNAPDSQNDGVLALNQPGSSMKPFLYALSLEPLKNDEPVSKPTDILADVPHEFGSEKLYIPSNFNERFNGPVRFRVALASSLNIPAVILQEKVGTSSYLKFLYKCGFDSLKITGQKADLGLSLGAGEVSLYELVRSFSSFTRDGKIIPLKFSDEIYDDFKEIQAISTDTARIITKFLSDKSARAMGFGYNQTFETDYPSIFKTGTANQYQSIVALGSTQRYTIGVWMGNFSGETVVGKTGSSLPASVAKKILDLLESGKNHEEFKNPENYELKKICALSGCIPNEFCVSEVYEFVHKNQKLNECSWHKKNGIELPSEYQRWNRITGENLEINYSSSNLFIETPKNGALFYYDDANSLRQAIILEAGGGNGKIAEVFYDNNLIATLNRPFVTKIPVERGNHTVKVVSEKENCTVEFSVK